jgi:hypothetical protein
MAAVPFLASFLQEKHILVIKNDMIIAFVNGFSRSGHPTRL